MRIARLVMLAFLLLAATSLVWATSDPQMIFDPVGGVGSGFCADPYQGNTPVSAFDTTNPFSFSSSSIFAYDGGKFFCLRNVDPYTWTSLDISITGLTNQFQANQISCLTDGFYFAACNLVVDPNTQLVTDLLYAGGPGVGHGATFSINIGPPASCSTNPNQDICGDWGPGNFNATATGGPVPEPASALLIVSGATLIVRRRRMKRG